MRVITWVAMVGLVACGPTGSDSAPDAGGENGGGGGGGGGGGSGPDAAVGTTELDEDDDHVADASDNCPGLSNKEQQDGDADGYGDACDCDPADPLLMGELVLQDSLGTNKNQFAVAPGFPAASWTYANNALRQNRLGDNIDDAIFFETALPLRNVMIEVTAASTEISDFGTTDRRQIFLIARADSAATKFAATACGIEVIEPIDPAERTSTITLGGTPASVTTVPIERTNRAEVQVNGEVYLRMDIKDDVMTCAATVNGTKTTAMATGLTAIDGKVGLFTRETKALFKNIRICSYR